MMQDPELLKYRSQDLSLAQRMADAPGEERQKILSAMDENQLANLRYNWGFWGRPSQQVPAGTWWTIWLLRSGRGAGKTRVGTETIRRWTQEAPRLHIVSRTAGAARDEMVEGPAGILQNAPPDEYPLYEPSKRKLTWPCGAEALIYSADEPDRLRGPQAYKFWADEVFAWRYPETWDMLMFGMRLGKHPQGVVTSTPRPIKLMKDLLARERTGQNPNGDIVVTQTSTYANADNLAPSFMREIVNRYIGTRLYRQEVLGELVEDVEGALWTVDKIEARRVRLNEVPEFIRSVIVVDPATGGGGPDTDEWGLLYGSLGDDSRGYVREDFSDRMGPEAAGNLIAKKWDLLRPDRLYVEDAFGQVQYVKLVLKSVGREDIPVSRSDKVRTGKQIRAEAASSLYEDGQDKMKHVGYFPLLEEQMTTWVPEETKESPNRIDALSILANELVLLKRGKVKISASYASGTLR